MDVLMLRLGLLAGFGGALLCVVAMAARVMGLFWLGKFQVGTLMQAGVAAMVFACFGLLVSLTLRSRNDRHAGP